MDGQFQIGDWIVEPSLNRLSRNGQQIRVEPKVMRVLICLAEAGAVVPKEKLMQTVWAGTYVSDDVLTRSISELRKAFDDDSKQPRFIETIPKGGYRLLMPVRPVRNGGNGHEPAPVVEPPSFTADPAPAEQPRRLWLWVAAAVLVTIAAISTLQFAGRERAGSPPPGKVVLAVLPFQNLSTDPDQQFFADGLTAEMISQLGRLPSDKINVIDWNSMRRYKGVQKTDDVIGGELGANYILEGTVRRSGMQVRITAELVHIGDRSHVWANSYDGELGDVLNLQSRLAREIASDIRVTVGPKAEEQLAKVPTLNPQGYDDYLRGKFAVQMNGDEGIRNSIVNLERSIALNPTYASGYVALANQYRSYASYGWAPAADAYPKMRAALEKALRMEPDDSYAHHELAWVLWRYDWNFKAADAEFKKSVTLNPSNALAHGEHALFLKSMGRFDEALAESRRAVELSPVDSYSRSNLAVLLAMTRHEDEASEQFAKVIAVDPNMPYTHERWGQALLWAGKNDDAIREFDRARELSHDQPEKLAWLAYALAKSGRRDEALKIVDRLDHRPKNAYLSPFHHSLVYIALGDREAAMRWLNEAYRQRDEWLVYLKVYPEFDPLRSDPRFQALVKSVGLE